MRGQNTLATVASGKGASALDLSLDDGELPRLHNGLMAVLNIVLGHLAVIGDFLLGQKIQGVGFLPCNNSLDTITRLQKGGSQGGAD